MFFSQRKTILLMVILTGCSSIPERNVALEDARTAYNTASSNPEVAKYASVELNQAAETFNRAESAWKNRDDSVQIEHYAYLAKQRAGLAQERANLKSAEANIESASADRDRIRLQARTREAEMKGREAELAKMNAEASQRQATDAQRRAEVSQRQATEALQQAALSQQQAQEAGERSRRLEIFIQELQIKQTERGLVMTLGDVLFDAGKAQLKPGGLRSIEKLADFLKQYPQRKVMIEGFTDSTGSAALNEELSQRRAETVRTALTGLGVSSERVTIQGWGAAYPVATNDTAAGRQLNRRVEIVISDDSGRVGSR